MNKLRAHAKQRKEIKMKTLYTAALVLLTSLFLAVAAYGQFGSAPLKSFTVSREEAANMAKAQAIIDTKFGAITLRFFPDAAPGHVKNFMELAKSGAYDKTIFHRVIPGFMIQGGDPTTKDPAKRAAAGTGGPGYTIKQEFNSRPHKRGTLSMARTGDPNGAGSQFFICVKDTPFLDNQYTVFGEVVSGIDVVDKIVSQPRDGRDNPNERIEMNVRIVEGK